MACDSQGRRGRAWEDSGGARQGLHSGLGDSSTPMDVEMEAATDEKRNGDERLSAAMDNDDQLLEKRDAGVRCSLTASSGL